MPNDKILIITSSIDCTADYIIGKYYNDIYFYRFNVDEFDKYDIDIGFLGQWSLKNKMSGEYIRKEHVKSIYYRKPLIPNLAEFEEPYVRMIQKDIVATVTGIADDFDGKVLSKPYLLRQTENKIFQLLYAKKNGWNTPESFIGNNNGTASHFSHKKSIIKPLTTGKIYHENYCELYQTSLFGEFEDDISLTPIYLQEYKQKKYEARVTIVNNDVFAVRIDSRDKIDWRRDYQGHKYSLIQCPNFVLKNCMKMLNDFGLKFGAFDFIVDESDNWIFLEVNPNGQWQWLEQSLGLNISDKIARFLLE